MNLQVINSILHSATMSLRSISLILSTFKGALVPCKHSSMVRIKAKFCLAFIHALILLLGSLPLAAVVQQYAKRNDCIPCSFLQNMKTQVVWTIHVPIEGFTGYTLVSFRSHSFYEQLKGYGVNGIWVMGWKPLRHKRPFAC